MQHNPNHQVPETATTQIPSWSSRRMKKRRQGRTTLTPAEERGSYPQPGDTVWLPVREVEGEVQQEVAPQSYLVESADGTHRRNRRHITQLPDRPPADSQADSEQTGSEQTAPRTEPPSSPPPPHRSSRLTRPPEWLDPSWANPGQNSV